jgi:hypothetical protein
MPAAFRVRASIPQSLVRTIGRAKTPPYAQLSAQLRADPPVQTMMMTPPISWLDERPFIALLSLVHEQLGDRAYVDAVHDAAMAMLQHGIFAAAQKAFRLFRRPGLGAYAKWAQRMWELSFQGMRLTYEGEDPVAGVKMQLSEPPLSGFTTPIVLGAAGVVQTVFTFARLPGRAQPLPYHRDDARVQLCLRVEPQ